MTKKWIAINLMLLIGAGLLGWQLYVAVKTFNAQNNISIAKTQTRKKVPAEGGLPASQPARKLSDADFTIIPTQDLFSESRKRETKSDVPPPPEIRQLDVKPILVGVLITSTQKLATILDTSPGAAPSNVPGQRRTQTMRIGDSFRSFTVTDINPEGMVLEYGASREVIPLFDSAKPPQSGKTPIIATRIVSFAPGAAPATGAPVQGLAQAAVGRGAGGGLAPVTTGSPRGGQAASGGQVRNAGPLGIGPATSIAQPGATRNAAPQGQMMNTPFGLMPAPVQVTQPVKK